MQSAFQAETWLQPHEISDSSLQLPGSYSFHRTRENNRGGGLCIFCRKLIQAKSEQTQSNLRSIQMFMCQN